MKSKRFFKRPIVLFSCLITVLMAMAATGDDEDPPKPAMMYLVTIQNLAMGQPLSPPIVATHEGGVRLFRVGKEASTELEAIARDGNQIPMFDLLTSSDRVFEVVDVGMPLTPSGSTVGGFTDSVTFMIQGRSGNKLSLTSMLICTNDGFVGLDRVKLPKKGSSVFTLHGFDAGVEDNTEMSTDIVDACSALGPVILSGDPNGNVNGAVDTVPRGVIMAHGGVLGVGDLGSEHQIPTGAAKVTITQVSDGGIEFSSPLGGAGEVPTVLTDASGEARFTFERSSSDDGEDDDDEGGDGDKSNNGKRTLVLQISRRVEAVGQEELPFRLDVKNIIGVTQAHIHLGLPNMNGQVVAFLYGPSDPSDRVDGRLAEGVLTPADLVGGPFEGNFAGFLEALGHGELYVNVHTAEFPGGEIRGQIGVRKAIQIGDGDPNRPPMGVITSPEGDESIAPGESVMFAGMASDPDGDPITVLWDFGDGGSSTEMSPGNHTYVDPGTYAVTFTATDDKGLSDPTPDMRTITVGAGNRPPDGVITSPTGDMTIMAGEFVTFAGMVSDPDGDPVTVLWDFGDGGSSTEMSPGNHTYVDPGTYAVTFTATDDEGLSDPTPDMRTITVETANRPPDVVISSPSVVMTIMACGFVMFAGMVSDPDGDPVTVLWDVR
jgi:hypothetical protein